VRRLSRRRTGRRFVLSSEQQARVYVGEIYFGLESGGQSGRTSRGLPPLCTVGAAEFEPPASGRTALFSTAIELDVRSPALPEVAAEEVVQLVSCFSLDGAVDCATAGPTTNEPARTAAATRLIILSPANQRIVTSVESKTFPGGKSSRRCLQLQQTGGSGK
jgi:hypothetical protein